MATFSYIPRLGARRTLRPRALSAPFGDGYEQRAGDGINTQLSSWVLDFNGYTATVDPIENFLIARNGVESFDWTPPTGSAAKFICREWSREELGNDIVALSATFEQVPA